MVVQLYPLLCILFFVGEARIQAMFVHFYCNSYLLDTNQVIWRIPAPSPTDLCNLCFLDMWKLLWHVQDECGVQQPLGK